MKIHKIVWKQCRFRQNLDTSSCILVILIWTSLKHCIMSSQPFTHKLNLCFVVPCLDKPFKELLIYSWIGCPYWFIKFVYLHVLKIKFVFRRKFICAKLLMLPWQSMMTIHIDRYCFFVFNVDWPSTKLDFTIEVNVQILKLANLDRHDYSLFSCWWIVITT